MPRSVAGFFLCAALGLCAGRRAQSIGVRVSEISEEATIAMVTTMANSLKILPTTPPISSTGRNTATSDAVIEMMVKPISRLPVSAASMGAMPSSMCRTMFSSMTMASSTTRPTASVRPSSEMLSMEKPSTYITPKVAISEVGTASVGISVAVTRRRKMKITSTTRPMVMASVISTSLTACLDRGRAVVEDIELAPSGRDR